MATEAVLKSLEELGRTLAPLNVPIAVMGGLSLAVWKHRRATYDVDVLAGIENADVPAIAATLDRAGFHPKGASALLTLPEAEFLQLVYEPPETFVDIQVDLLLARSDFEREALSRRIRVSASEIGTDIDVLSCEDVIILKLFAGRIIDRADVAALLRLNRDRIDMNYLLRWVRQRNLLQDLTEAWGDAFPGESAPN